jgi:hypothetical protein
VKWSGGKFGHLANMVEDEDMNEFKQVVLIGGLNNISGDMEID